MEILKKDYPALEGLGIVSVYLFGSRAQGVAKRDSDYDFGILLKDPSILRHGSMELYQKIYDLLQDRVQQRVDLDIVFLDTAPNQLRYQVFRYGEVLYDGSALLRGKFIERTLEEHADFESYRRLFEESALSQIS